MRSIKINKNELKKIKVAIKKYKDEEMRIKHRLFEDSFNSYMDTYKEHQEIKIKLDQIKQGIKNHYETQDERLFKTNGVVARTKTKKDYAFKEEIYDFLEDYGYLPLVVKINSGVEKYFNLEKAKINHKESVRLYTGGKSIVDKDHMYAKYDNYLEQDLDELTNEFKKTYTQEKLLKENVEEAKEKLKKAMPAKNIKTEYGTLKLTESYDYDPNIIFSGVSGKKEIFIRKLNDTNDFEIVIYPENKFAKCTGDLELGNITVEQLYSSPSSDTKSSFIKKSEFNKLIKSGYIFNKFQVEAEPMEFFRKCDISKTKISELIQKGIIDENEVKPFIEVEKESYFVEVLTEGAIEQQSAIFDKKLAEKAQNYRRRKNPNFTPTETNVFSEENHIDLSDFSF